MDLFYKLLLLFAIVNCGSGLNKTPIWNATYTDQLKRDLLMNYDKFARPSHHENVTKVDVRLTVRHVDIDEAKSIMTVFSWFKMQWNDEKLKWNASEYGNLELLHMADHEVWQPDVVLYNSAGGSTIDHYGRTNCLVYPNGKVLWVPPSLFQVLCELDLHTWPFDTQVCNLIVGSWTYSGNQIDLTLEKQKDAPNGVEIELSVQNHEWEIKKIETARNVKTYACCEEPYVDVAFNFTLARRSPMYKTVIVGPLTAIILATLVAFWLPPTCGEKILLNSINLIVICIFLIYFATQLPVLAHRTPLVVLFYCNTLYLVSFSLVISVLVINLSKNKKGQVVPYFVRNVLDGWFGSFLGLNLVSFPQSPPPRAEELQDTPFDDTIKEDHQVMNSKNSKSSAQHECYWLLLATAIDRIAFLLYCIIFIVLAIRLLA